MSEQFELQAERRTDTGKGVVRKLRKQGIVPGVYYDKKGENIALQMPYGNLEKVYARAHKSNVVNLTIKDAEQSEKKPVLFWDVQDHPAKNLILHVDFLGVDLTEEMDVDVAIEVTGTAKGEESGGIVHIYRDSLSVTCLPTSIPDTIEIDVSELDINDNVYVEDLTLPEGVRLKDYEENFAVVGVSPPEATLEEEEAAAEEEAAEEEGGESEEE